MKRWIADWPSEGTIPVVLVPLAIAVAMFWLMFDESFWRWQERRGR